nr:polysaccharide pyruvyl transferase family protein [uncultured Anaerostipes sp.]
MKIGIMGVALQSTNKGCEALAYSFLEILNSIAKRNNETYEVLYIQKMPTKKFIENKFSINKTIKEIGAIRDYSNLTIKYCLPWHTKKHIFYKRAISSCAMVVDFTEGDSFSDIYGEERFWSDTNYKMSIIGHGVPYILGSQTIGPFATKQIAEQAKKIILECKEVFARDKLSYECAKDVSGREVILTTDIAFKLPYDKINTQTTHKVKVGFNPSGLLWAGGIEKENQFGLKVDYKRYCRSMLQYFTKRNDCLVYLIPHATSVRPDGTIEIDSDLNACNELKAEFKECVAVDEFVSCISAKSYIATMDFFIGARMHATIAAMSTGVSTIPFSYSRKFEGLFGELQYPYLISGRSMTTEEAIHRSIEWFENIDSVRQHTNVSLKLALERIKIFEATLDKYMRQE